jgi:4-hydroxybenzoate polyprenyltransferase
MSVERERSESVASGRSSAGAQGSAPEPEPRSARPPADAAPTSAPPSAASPRQRTPTPPGERAEKTSEPPDADAGLIATPPILPESPKETLLWRVRGMIRTVRPHQWVKNSFVLAPVVFAKHLTHPSVIKNALLAFCVFCLLAGCIYTINDLKDVDADRVHPRKRDRPIASGRVPASWAKVMVAVLAVTALAGAALGPPAFLAVAAGYLVLNLAYTFKLKHVAYLDVACIALGFVLRVLAGGFATRTEISVYMIACTLLLALFLGFGKRRHEIAGVNASKQRAALEAYSPRVLTAALAVTGVASVAMYAAYTLDPHTTAFFGSDWLWITTIHPLFGVIRFLQLVAGRPKSESPTQEMLRDVPFVLNIVLWLVEVMVIVYRLRPTGA